MPKDPNFYPAEFSIEAMQSGLEMSLQRLENDTYGASLRQTQNLQAARQEIIKNQSARSQVYNGRIPFVFVGSIDPIEEVLPPPPIPPTIGFSPPAISFELTTIGEASAWQFVQIRHSSGEESLTINEITVPEGIELSTVIPNMSNQSGGIGNLPTTIPPGGSGLIALRFVPTQPGTVHDRITVASNAVDQEPLVVNGRGVAPTPKSGKINLSNAIVSFEETITGEFTSWHQVIVSNIGDGDLTLSAIAGDASISVTRVNGTETINGSNFDVIPHNPVGELPCAIPPGEWRVFALRTNPTTDGFYKGTVTVRSNDEDTPAYPIYYSGNAGTNTPPPMPRISVINPTSIAFGEIETDTTSSWVVVNVNNNGDSNLTVSGVAADWANLELAFSGSGIGFTSGKELGTFPSIVPAGDYRQFAARIQPYSLPLNLESSVLIASNAINSPEYPVAVTATIVDPPPVLEPEILAVARDTLSGLINLREIGGEAGIFLIQGSSGTSFNFSALYAERNANFNNEVGFVIVEGSNGVIDGVAPGNAGYVNAAMSSGGKQIIVNSGTHPSGQAITFSLPGGTYLIFYLVSNASSADWLAASSDKPYVFFSGFPILTNPDSLVHVRDTKTSNYRRELVFEDMFALGDYSWDDAIIEIKLQNSALPSPTNPTTTAITTSGIDFGSIIKGIGEVSSTAVVRITNSGEAALTVSNLTASNNVFGVVESGGDLIKPIGEEGSVIPVGDFRELGVIAVGDNGVLGIQTENLTITSNAANYANIEIPLTIEVIDVPLLGAPPERGTVAYFVGGDSFEYDTTKNRVVTRLNFQGGDAESTLRGVDLINERQWACATGNTYQFFVVGGDSVYRKYAYNHYERVIFDTGETSQTGTEIGVEFSMATGAASPHKAYVFGADTTLGNEPANFGGTLNLVFAIDHGDNTLYSLGGLLSKPKAFHNSSCGANGGIYLLGGSQRGGGNEYAHSFINEIEKFDYNDESSQVIGTSLASWDAWTGVAFGNHNSMYLAGGRNDGIDRIQRFNLPDESITELGITINPDGQGGMMAGGAAGGNRYGYFAGGYKVVTGLASTEAGEVTGYIHRLKPMENNETIVPIGARIATNSRGEQDQAKGAGISNYQALLFEEDQRY